MVSWRRLTLELMMMMAIVLTVMPQGAMATTTLHADGEGWVGGSVVEITREANVMVIISGSAPFDLYFVTAENFQKLNENISFGYLDHMSRLNVTSANIEGSLPAGSYVWWIYAREGGDFSYETTNVAYSAGNLDWFLITVAAFSAVIGAGGSFVATRRWYKRE